MHVWNVWGSVPPIRVKATVLQLVEAIHELGITVYEL